VGVVGPPSLNIRVVIQDLTLLVVDRLATTRFIRWIAFSVYVVNRESEVFEFSLNIEQGCIDLFGFRMSSFECVGQGSIVSEDVSPFLPYSTNIQQTESYIAHTQSTSGAVRREQSAEGTRAAAGEAPKAAGGGARAAHITHTHTHPQTPKRNRNAQTHSCISAEQGA